MKKALSLLLSAALVVTGVNVTTNTASAEDNVISETGYTAVPLYSSLDGKVSCWSLDEISGLTATTATVKGNETYTVSLAGSNAGATAYVGVEIKNICTATDDMDLADVKVGNVIVKCDDEVVSTDSSKIQVGNLDGKESFKIVVLNDWNSGSDDFTFKKTISVTFTLSGIKKATADTAAYYGKGTAVDESEATADPSASASTDPEESASTTPATTEASTGAVVVTSEAGVTTTPTASATTVPSAAAPSASASAGGVTTEPSTAPTTEPSAEPVADQDQAFLMYTDGNWGWGNFHIKGAKNDKGEVAGFGTNAAVTDNRTYTASIRKPYFENPLLQSYRKIKKILPNPGVKLHLPHLCHNWLVKVHNKKMKKRKKCTKRTKWFKIVAKLDITYKKMDRGL